MQHEVYVRLVDAHSARDSGHDYLDLVANEKLLIALSVFVSQSRVVRAYGKTVGFEIAGKFLHLPPGKAVDDARLFRKLSEKADGLPQRVLLKIYNVIGEQVAELVNEIKSPGNYSVEFDCSELSSGVYLYRMSLGSKSMTRKMVILK